MNYTHTLGSTTECKCILAFTELGYTCLTPVFGTARYDFIVDIDNKFVRIQCKCSRYTNDDKIAFEFNTSSTVVTTKKCSHRKYTKDEIDFFATSIGGQVYLVPVELCNGQTVCLRFEPPKDGTTYKKAKNFLLSTFFQPAKQFLESKTKIHKKAINKYRCPICGGRISKKGNICVDCYKKKRKKQKELKYLNLVTKKPLDRNFLKHLIRTTSFCGIGKIYGVSDNAVRKWCKSYNLPYKVRDIKHITDEDWIYV